jgi:hypothetical protein
MTAHNMPLYVRNQFNFFCGSHKWFMHVCVYMCLRACACARSSVGGLLLKFQLKQVCIYQLLAYILQIIYSCCFQRQPSEPGKQCSGTIESMKKFVLVLYSTHTLKHAGNEDVSNRRTQTPKQKRDKEGMK